VGGAAHGGAATDEGAVGHADVADKHGGTADLAVGADMGAAGNAHAGTDEPEASAKCGVTGIADSYSAYQNKGNTQQRIAL